jgi:anti-sigma regulatory factor (Ser/Thr protein kinase)
VENGKTKQSQGIRRYLIDAIRNGRANVVTDASEQFGISRQSVHRHLSHLTKNGFLEASGSTRGRAYRLGRNRAQRGIYDLSAIAEDRVYTTDFAYIVDDLAKNVADIWHYGFTEMLNNAIDHSGGTEAHILATRTDEWLVLVIRDDGEGIFKRIARLLSLGDPREAILELSKGKLTTDPGRHTGEGIFFTSRVFDAFQISSGELAFSHAKDQPSDVLVHLKQPASTGTTVFMAVSPATDRTLASVFDAFTDSETLDFSKTVVPVRLALYEGDQLVSRSQAKRIMNRVERFRHVMLDFEGVETVGRSFVDEIFRVFAREHPHVDMLPVGMVPSVRREIERLYTPRPNVPDKPNAE